MSATYDITLPADHDYLASLPDGTPYGIRDELELRADGVAVLFMRTAKIASYAGESVTTPYRSTTGALTTGATVSYLECLVRGTHLVDNFANILHVV